MGTPSKRKLGVDILSLW